jgi:hypothetical protein
LTSTITITSDHDQQLKQLQDRFRANQQKILRAIGERLLQLALDDYGQKMSGGTGVDGTQWKPVTQAAIVKRAQRRPGWKANLESRRKLTREEAELMKGIRSKLPKGAEHGSARRAMVAQFLDGNPEYESLKQERVSLRQEMESLVNAADNGLIGYSLGDQLASFAKGYSGPGGGGNVFEIDANSVTVGVDRNYSEAFDSLRSIFPDDLPAEWREDLENTLTEELNEAVR